MLFNGSSRMVAAAPLTVCYAKQVLNARTSVRAVSHVFCEPERNGHRESLNTVIKPIAWARS